MNVADSRRVASALEKLSYEHTAVVEDADVIILNTCVVRQSAEDKAYGRLSSLRPLKERRPELVINLMGCLVGVRTPAQLKRKLPWVDVFSPPSDPAPLLAYLIQSQVQEMEAYETEQRHEIMDFDRLPAYEQDKLVSAYIPVVLGCSYACSYCVIPLRRGGEKSRPPQEILYEARTLVAQGVREITLLGQIVDRYGKDRSGFPSLAGLIRLLNETEGLARIRFLTSHPNWMMDELLDVVAELPKVMPHIEVPIQSGDDEILERMRRGYTSGDYRRLVDRIRQRIPGVAIATDVIVGFPGETEAQFQNTYDLMAELKMDVAHLARYSPRPGTHSERKMEDDVPAEEKMRRFRMLEDLQKEIATEINAGYFGQRVDVLFEEKIKGRWKGRTPTNKLVFVEADEDLRGQVKSVHLTWTGPWSMIGRLLPVSSENSVYMEGV